MHNKNKGVNKKYIILTAWNKFARFTTIINGCLNSRMKYSICMTLFNKFRLHPQVQPPMQLPEPPWSWWFNSYLRQLN